MMQRDVDPDSEMQYIMDTIYCQIMWLNVNKQLAIRFTATKLQI